MNAYYNEVDPFAADWLRRLMLFGEIADGEVDERSIEDVTPDDLRGFTQCHFFAGIGVWSYALKRAGWPDDRPVWTGSCPCQPFSAAGKGGGVNDPRHLWPAWFWLIDECRPVAILGEQVAAPAGLGWFDLVSFDLERAGYTVGAHDLCAAGIGAPHIRQRLYFVAHTGDVRHVTPEGHRRAAAAQIGAGGAVREQRLRVELGADGGDVVAHTLSAGRAEGGPRPGIGSASSSSSSTGGPLDAAGEQARFSRRTRESGGTGVGALADDDGGGQGEGRHDTGEKRGLQEAQRESEHRAVVPRGDGGVGGVAFGSSREQSRRLRDARQLDDTLRLGWVEDGRDASDGSEAGRGGSEPLVGDAGPTCGFWRGADWIWCRDGKYRPVEAGTFPLASGVAGRVGLLRGYGNALCAPVAQAFIEAVMDVL